MADRFDLSTGPGPSQRLVFALFGIGQLVVSSVAFQRGGFPYGLVVLCCGILAFCTAAFFVHRLNRHLVWLGPEGIVVEEGLNSRRELAWEQVNTVNLDENLMVFHAKTGEDLVLHGAFAQAPEYASLLEKLRDLATARGIPIEGEI
jgi:hypothetical protein